MMTFDRHYRSALLEECVETFLDLAMQNVTREFPVSPHFVADRPGLYPTHREMHPAFYGSFDWHSCVEMVWVAVVLARRHPESPAVPKAVNVIDSLLTPEAIAGEVAFFSAEKHSSIERPYGWGWLLTLSHELHAWDDPDAQRWQRALQPLANLLAERFITWLPRLTYAQRTGLHPNTAFALSCAHGEGMRRAAAGDDRLERAIEDGARRWFAQDRDYPSHYEPSGADFLSPALTEAELMSKLLPQDDFSSWLARFLPGIAQSKPDQLFEPAVVSDQSDGQLAHLAGLNLSRAWACVAIAERLPAGDERIGPLLASAELHAKVALPMVSGTDYMLEHWLAAYATLLLTA